MSGDLKQFLEQQRQDVLKEKRRLHLLKPPAEDKENVLPGSPPNELDRPQAAERGRQRDFDLHGATKEDRDGGARRETGLGDGGKRPVENVPSAIEPLDLGRCHYNLDLEDKKHALIDRAYEAPYTYRSSSDEGAGLGAPEGGVPFGLPLLRRRGDYAPSRHARLRAAPHLGLGEYDVGREGHKQFYSLRCPPKNISAQQVSSPKSDRSTNTERSIDTKSVQTDIQNLDNELVVVGHGSSRVSPRRTTTDNLVDAALLRPRPSTSSSSTSRLHYGDQRLTSAQNERLLRAAAGGNTASMDKPKSILSNRRTGSPRGLDRYASDLGYTRPTFMDGFSSSDPTEELERERLKRMNYQHELRLQIDENRHLALMRDEQERREREMEQHKLEQQLLRLREEQTQEYRTREKRHELMRRHSDDLLRRKTELHEMQRPWRRHADSESANLDSLGLGGGAPSYGYSPPVSRRTAAPLSPFSSTSAYNVPATSVFSDPSASNRYNYQSSNRFDSSASYPGGILRNRSCESGALPRMESFNSYDTVPLSRRTKFDRFDSLSRIDSLSHRLETMSVRDGYASNDLTDVQRRHSATQQDLSLSRSPRLRRRNSSSRFEDSLPIPVLKARSPVAKELRNAVPFSSHRTGSDAHRRLEDRWQIPAVQKNILHPYSLDSPVGSRGSILTQLGSIRAQLQREQLRMDETLRRRGLLRNRTEDY